MHKDIVDFTARTLLRDLRERVEAAVGIAKAAHVLADAGLTDKGVELANDVDELIHDAEKLLGLVTMVARSTTPAAQRSTDDRNGTADDSAGPEAASDPLIDPTLADATVRAFLAQADERLRTALGIARAAEICVAAGKLADGVRIALDLEPLLYDARHFVNTASIVRRMTDP